MKRAQNLACVSTRPGRDVIFSCRRFRASIWRLAREPQTTPPTKRNVSTAYQPKKKIPSHQLLKNDWFTR